MDLPSQPLSSEETGQHLHSTEEPLIKPSSASDSPSEETEQQQVTPAVEDAPTHLISPSEETEQQQVTPAVEDAPTHLISPSEETEQQQVIPAVEEDAPTHLISPSEPLAQETEQEADDEEAFDEDEDDEEGVSVTRPGVFIGRGLLIAAACAVVVVALLATLLVVVNRPKDPPADWIASYTPATSGKILYYLHWTNQNGELQGQLQLATIANGSLQSATAPTTGLYSKDNHIIYVVITLNGQASTLMGKINDASDTLTLHSPGTTSQSVGLVFHTGSANDYKQATKKLGSGK